jgi:uncharacterized protein
VCPCARGFVSARPQAEAAHNLLDCRVAGASRRNAKTCIAPLYKADKGCVANAARKNDGLLAISKTVTTWDVMHSLLNTLPPTGFRPLAWLWGLLLSMCLAFPPAMAQLAVPALTAHVIDTTDTLSAPQVQQLEQQLSAFETSRGTQIVLLLVPSTQPEDIFSYANRVANTWKIGRKEIGDGLLLIVAKNDRTVRIEVAKTLEGPIPDLAAKRIIEQAITPRFKEGDFAGGLTAGATQLMALVAGENLPLSSAPASRPMGGLNWNDLAVLMFFAIPMIGAIARIILGRKLGTLATGVAIGGLALLFTSSLLIAGLAAVLGLVFSLFSNLMPHLPRSSRRGPGGWGSGSSGGGLGGGGFGSGGGGNFGGGGASGRW